MAAIFLPKELPKQLTPEGKVANPRHEESIRKSNVNFANMYEKGLMRNDKSFENSQISFHHMYLLLTNYTDNNIFAQKLSITHEKLDIEK